MICNLILNFLELFLFIMPVFIVDYFYIDPHYDAFVKLLQVNDKIISKNQTFLIIGGALYPRTYKVLLKLGIPINNICIWDYSKSNIDKTRKHFPTIKIEHRKYDETSIIEYDNVILPLAFSKCNSECIKQYKYNLIIHDYISVFYNNPLITYYNIYLGVKKLTFIPSVKNYLMNDVKILNNSNFNTLCFLIGCLTTFYIPFAVTIYKHIYPPPDNINGRIFYTLNEYFLRELTVHNGNNYKNETIMPCCGIIKDIGVIRNNALFTHIKGENISLYTNYNHYINIFIRPNDYHYIHSPIQGAVSCITSYNGIRSLLIPYELDKLNLSIIENTKVIIQIQNKTTSILIIMIGGLFVGSIQLFVNENFKINAGDKIGYFNFGSSILLLHNENNISHKLHDTTRIYNNL